MKSKIGPLPLWGWAVVGGGLLAFFWWQRSKSGTVAAGSVVGGSTAGGVGSPTDLLTLEQVLQAMQDLATKNGGTAASPPPPTPPPPGTGGKPCPPGMVGVGQPYCAWIGGKPPNKPGKTIVQPIHYLPPPGPLPSGNFHMYNNTQKMATSLATTHSNGGRDTAKASTSFIPPFMHPASSILGRRAGFSNLFAGPPRIVTYYKGVYRPAEKRIIPQVQPEPKLVPPPSPRTNHPF